MQPIRMPSHSRLPFALASALFAACAFANDSTARIGAGGIALLKSEDIRMVEEKLDISTKKIEVHYRFLNEGKEAISTAVAFPLPPYRWDPENQNSGSLKGLQVSIDGRPVATQRIRKALARKRDITGQLRAIGLSDAQIFETFGGACSDVYETGCELTNGQRAEVAKLLGLRTWYPKWEVQETYVWNQTFPAGEEIEVRHEYAPFVGSIYTFPYQYGAWVGDSTVAPAGPGASKLGEEACVDGGIWQTVNRKVQGHAAKGASMVQVFLRDVEYVLGTGRNWKGAIGRFTLRVHKESPDQVVSLCMAGKPKRIDATTFEFTQLQFVPQDRLVVYFFSIIPYQ